MRYFYNQQSVESVSGVKTGDFSVTPSDGITIYLINPSAPMTVTLPDPVVVGAGYKVGFKDQSGAASINRIILNTPGGERIDGSPTYNMSIDFECVILESDGTNWNII